MLRRLEAPPFLGRCFDDREGAWLTSLEALVFSESMGGALSVRWALARVTRDGRRASIVPDEGHDDVSGTKGSNYAWGGAGELDVQVTPLDADGDGVLEIAVLLHGKYHEGEEVSRGRIFAVEGGRIVPYRPARDLAIERLSDIDGDGRLDLVTYGPYAGLGVACPSGFSYRVTGPALVAHARPDGSFAMDDGVSRAAAQRACPAPPAVVVAKGRPTSPEVIACARLWGATTEELNEALAARCDPLPEDGSCSPTNNCPDRELLGTWAAVTPPLTLRPHAP